MDSEQVARIAAEIDKEYPMGCSPEQAVRLIAPLVIEECAKVAESWEPGEMGVEDRYCAELHIATALRSMKEQGDG